MVEWHHSLDIHKFEQVPGFDDGQGSLVCCRPWGRKELDVTEQLKLTEQCFTAHIRKKKHLNVDFAYIFMM